MSETIYLPKKHPGYPSAYWVALAANRLDDSGFMGVIKSEGDSMVATDGHRLHIAPTVLPEGFWRVVKRSKSQVVLEQCEVDSYPPWQRLAPPEGLKGEPVPVGAESVINGYTAAIAKTWRQLHGTNVVNVLYLADVFSREGEWTVSQPEENKTVYLVHGDGYRVSVMPMQQA